MMRYFILFLGLLSIACIMDKDPLEVDYLLLEPQEMPQYTDGERMSLIEYLLKPGTEVARQWVFQRFPGQEYWLSYATHDPAQVWFWQGPNLRSTLDQALDEFGVYGSGCQDDSVRINRLDALPLLCDPHYACMYWGAHTGPVVNLCFDLHGCGYWFQNPKARICVDALATIKAMVIR